MVNHTLTVSFKNTGLNEAAYLFYTPLKHLMIKVKNRFWKLVVMTVFVIVSASIFLSLVEQYKVPVLYGRIFFVGFFIITSFITTRLILKNIKPNQRKDSVKTILIFEISLFFLIFIFILITNVITNFMANLGGIRINKPLWMCPKEAREVFRVAKSQGFKTIYFCSAQPSSLSSEKATLVILGLNADWSSHGYGYYALVKNGEIIEVPPEPDISAFLEKQFGEWCTDKTIRSGYKSGPKNNGVKKVFTSDGRNYHWNYIFDDFDTEESIRERLKEDKYLATVENPQSCILNGTLTVLETSNVFDVKKADISNFSVSYKLLPRTTPIPIEEVLNDCFDWDLANCYSRLAAARKDPEFCMEISTPTNWSVDQLRGSCLSNVANISGDKDICELIVSEKQKSKCHEHFEQ